MFVESLVGLVLVTLVAIFSLQPSSHAVVVSALALMFCCGYVAHRVYFDKVFFPDEADNSKQNAVRVYNDSSWSEWAATTTSLVFYLLWFLAFLCLGKLVLIVCLLPFRMVIGLTVFFFGTFTDDGRSIENRDDMANNDEEDV